MKNIEFIFSKKLLQKLLEEFQNIFKLFQLHTIRKFGVIPLIDSDFGIS